MILWSTLELPSSTYKSLSCTRHTNSSKSQLQGSACLATFRRLNILHFVFLSVCQFSFTNVILNCLHKIKEKPHLMRKEIDTIYQTLSHDCNPTVHAATGMVYSTGGCMHKKGKPFGCQQFLGHDNSCRNHHDQNCYRSQRNKVKLKHSSSGTHLKSEASRLYWQITATPLWSKAQAQRKCMRFPHGNCLATDRPLHRSGPCQSLWERLPLPGKTGS